MSIRLRITKRVARGLYISGSAPIERVVGKPSAAGEVVWAIAAVAVALVVGLVLGWWMSL